MSNYEPMLLNTQELQDNTKVVLDKLYNILAKSYGPLGENTIINRGNDSPIVTKDGLTILKAVRFEEPHLRDIYKLIYSISNALVDKVGDGSTSAVISASNLFSSLKEVRKGYSNAKKFNKALSLAQELLEDTIKLFLTRTISGNVDERQQVLSQIAGVSNNNDFDIGTAIANVLSRCNADSLIKIKDNPSENGPIISYTTTNGFSLERYRLNHGLYFTGPKTKQGFDVDNALVFMSYNMLDVHYNYLIKTLIPSMEKPVPIIVIAETIQKEVSDQITKDAFTAVTSGKIPAILLVETGGLSSTDAITRFSDLQAYVNANAGLANTITATNEGKDVPPGEVVGYSQRVNFLPNGTITFENGGGYKFSTNQFVNHLKAIQEELDNTPRAMRAQVGSLRARLMRMNGVTATIYVGGRTQEEKETTRFLVEDSVAACQSVLKNGYTMGGNYTPYYAAIILFMLSSKSKEALEEFNFSEDILALLEKAKQVDWNIINAVQAAYLNTMQLPFTTNQIELSYEEKGKLTNCLNNGINSPEKNEFLLYNSSSEQIESFDLFSEKVNTSVISPVSTDIEIMNATFSIVTLLLTSNQYIS